MHYSIEQELNRFSQWGKKFSAANVRVEEVCEYGWALIPEGGRAPAAGKDFNLTVMGLTHGNELAGCAVVNDVIESVLGGLITLSGPVCFILGNPWAAKENRRFLESDLNRSFMRQELTTREHRRARDLEAVLSRTEFLIDFHQTREQCEEPFFIFPYTKGGFTFARRILPDTPIVTHWGDSFSKDGRCTDEYTNTQGGVGVSIEIGQNGFGAYSIGFGYKACLRAIAAAAGLREDEPQTPATIYTWSKVVENVDFDGQMEPGWFNFKQVSSGDVIGHVGGQTVVAGEGGRILFPYYRKSPQEKAPAELCRLMRQVEVGELPS